MLLPIVAYIGPETVLPLTSVLAAVGGAALLFWSYLRRAAAWCCQCAQRAKPREDQPAGR